MGSLRAFATFFLATRIFIKQAHGQSASFPASCLPESGVTALPQCNFVAEKVEECGPSMPLPQRHACYCTQEVLAALFDCKSQQRLCLGNNDFDSAVDNVIKNWHVECDAFVSSESSSFTTPQVTSLTWTYDVLNCQSIGQSCQRALQASSSCATLFTAEADLNSCLCAPSILSLASVCEYDGNVSCKATTANIESVYGWGTCSGYQTILTTPRAASVTLSTSHSGSSGASTSGSLTITKPAFTTPSPSHSQSIASGKQHLMNLVVWGAITMGFSIVLVLA